MKELSELPIKPETQGSSQEKLRLQNNFLGSLPANWMLLLSSCLLWQLTSVDSL